MLLNKILIFFGILSVICSVMIIASKNPIHSILYLIAVFLNITFIFIVIGAEFIAITFLIVYVGAIAVLFLFVVMMLNIKIIELEENTWKYTPIGLLISLIFLVQLSLIFKFDLIELYSIFSGENFYIIKKIEYTGEFVLVKNNVNLDYSYLNVQSSNSEILGWFLYTYNFAVFFVISMILLIAMIGSISLVLNQNINIRRQLIFKQTLRDLKSSISLNIKK